MPRACAPHKRDPPPSGPPSPHAAPTTARPPRRYAPLLPFMNWRHVRQPVAGAVFVTGADSGMGQWTATRLASAGFRVYAGCFAPNSDKELKAKARGEGGEAAASNVIIVPLDVTKDESVSAAAARVAKDEAKAPNGGLVGVINCAGMGFNGPAEYFPLAMLKQQMEVNFIGYVRVVQDSAARALMCRPPVARSRTARPNRRVAPPPRPRRSGVPTPDQGCGRQAGRAPRTRRLHRHRRRRHVALAAAALRVHGVEVVGRSVLPDAADGDADEGAPHRRVHAQPGAEM